MASLESWLLDILACPRCHGKVEPTPEQDGLVCPSCRVVYPVEDGIPQMLPDAGKPLPGEDPAGP